jgi:hypothetical protein
MQPPAGDVSKTTRETALAMANGAGRPLIRRRGSTDCGYGNWLIAGIKTAGQKGFKEAVADRNGSIRARVNREEMCIPTYEKIGFPILEEVGNGKLS